MTVAELKSLIQDREGLAPERYWLTWSSRVMEDAKKLSDYNLKNWQLLILNTRHVGGMFFGTCGAAPREKSRPRRAATTQADPAHKTTGKVGSLHWQSSATAAAVPSSNSGSTRAASQSMVRQKQGGGSSQVRQRSVGIRNVGNTCYLASAMQGLHSLPEFVADLSALRKSLYPQSQQRCAVEEHYPVYQGIVELFDQMS